MSRPSAELTTHITALAIEVEVIERAAYRRRMMPALELEFISLRWHVKCLEKTS